MARCEATASTPGRPNFGNQCQRSAVHGSTHCERHGGVQDSTRPDEIQRRIDRPAIYCRANKRNGEPCKNYAMQGGALCKKHGGNLPQVQAAARRRMMELTAPAIAQLQEILTKPNTSDADRLRAVAMILDRTGFGPKAEMTVDVKPYEKLMMGIYREVTGAEELTVEADEDVVDAEVVPDRPPVAPPRDDLSADDDPAEEPYPEDTIQRGALSLVRGSALPPKRLPPTRY